jgi:hypothetical protein
MERPATGDFRFGWGCRRSPEQRAGGETPADTNGNALRARLASWLFPGNAFTIQSPKCRTIAATSVILIVLRDDDVDDAQSRASNAGEFHSPVSICRSVSISVARQPCLSADAATV